MKKLTTIALAGMLAVSSVAVASVSRWGGFGEAAAFISDVQDIWTLPGVVAANPDAMYLEFGAVGAQADNGNTVQQNAAVGNNAWGGAHVTLGPGVLGLWTGKKTSNYAITGYLSNPTAAPITGSAPAAIATYDPTNIYDQLVLLYGLNIGDNVALGMGISRGICSASSTEFTPAGGSTSKTNDSGGDFGILLGAELKDLGPIALLETGITFYSAGASTLDNDGTVENKKTLAANELNLRVGGTISGDNGGFQRVELGVNYASAVSKLEYAEALPNTHVESKVSGIGYNLGWAKGKSGEKGMGLLGLMLKGMSGNIDDPWNGSEINKSSVSDISINVAVAGEAKVKEWLQARAGLSNVLWSNTTWVSEWGVPGAVNKWTTSNSAGSAGTITAGLSFIFGDITIDGVLNQDVLYTGTYLISGVAESLHSMVSATWGWGGAKE